jgi:superfamily II DNA helicase RecQ
MQSMHEQYHLRCKSHHMSCQTWSPVTSPDNPPFHILVIIEHSDFVVFHTFVSHLVSSHHLSRAVGDEAHIGLTHDTFQAVMKTLRWLGSIACQILLLSATVGPSLVDDLFAALGITHYVVLHEPTNRPNLSFNITHSFTPHQTLDYTVHDILSQPAPHKAIIFCRSREVAELITGHLGIPFCHGRMIPPEINSVLFQLRMGIVRLIVSTSVLEVTLDVMNLKWVINNPYTSGYPFSGYPLGLTVSCNILL